MSGCDGAVAHSLSGHSSLLLPEICAYAKKHNLFVAHNPGGSQLAGGAKTVYESLPAIDILLLNSTEAQQLMNSLCLPLQHIHHASMLSGIAGNQQNIPILLQKPFANAFNILNFFSFILAHGPKIVVVTNGAEGVYVATSNAIYFHPSIESPIVSTIGAGDAFNSTFTASILQEKHIENAIIDGLVNSASVITFLDAKEGLLAKHVLEKKALGYTSWQFTNFQYKQVSTFP